MPSSSPVISTHDAAASFLPSRWARSSTRCKSSADIEAPAEPITPIFRSGLCMVLSSSSETLLGYQPKFCLRPLCPQILQQRLGLLEVGGVKPLGEPSVDRCE